MALEVKPKYTSKYFQNRQKYKNMAEMAHVNAMTETITQAAIKTTKAVA